MVDGFSQRYGDLLAGSYDCVDRIVLNAYYPLGHDPGGFRVWWRRWHDDSDAELDNTHLMRLAGRFARRVRAWAGANGVAVIDCGRGERKHRIVEEYLATHTVVGPCVFLVLVAKAPATVWEVRRGGQHDVIVNIAKKTAYVNHYSFHIMDPVWGHVTIKMSGHPPFAAQVILNGHEYVARQAQAAGIAFTKEGNCFTAVANPHGLAQVADTLSQDATAGRLSQVCDRWIHTACLCFGLDLDDQQRSGFRYNYSVYQVEYSRNLIFRVGGQMDRVFNTVVDRTRSRLDVPTLRTMFGAKRRPGANGTPDLSPKLAVVIETPRWDLTLFKVHFGLLTLKAYTKGEHVLRFEAVTHNTRQLGCGRTLDKFPTIVTRLAGMVDRFTTTLDCVDIGFIPDATLDELPTPSQIGATRVGGVDLNKPRIRAALAAVLALAIAPDGFTVADLTAKVRTMTGQTDTDYTIRQAAYDLRKLRGKRLVDKPGRSPRYQVPDQPARTIAALLALRDQIIAPILAGVRSPRIGRKPAHWTQIDRDYETLRINMQSLFRDLAITTTA
jgi:DNA-binding transcriptional ArsR family regulator